VWLRLSYDPDSRWIAVHDQHIDLDLEIVVLVHGEVTDTTLIRAARTTSTIWAPSRTCQVRVRVVRKRCVSEQLQRHGPWRHCLSDCGLRPMSSKVIPESPHLSSHSAVANQPRFNLLRALPSAVDSRRIAQQATIPDSPAGADRA
jgi:hypothetical protein